MARALRCCLSHYLPLLLLAPMHAAALSAMHDAGCCAQVTSQASGTAFTPGLAWTPEGGGRCQARCSKPGTSS